MPVMIQVRNVPDELHRTLKARAALSGMSLSDYVLIELRRLAERPTREDLQRRLSQRTSVTPGERIAKAVAAERLSR
jgi:plasmid stability protein